MEFSMQTIRPILHEILNALAISRGLAEAVQMSLQGDIPLSDEQKKDKLQRSINAMDRIETACKEIRQIIIEKDESKS